MHIGRRIKTLRELHGWSQEQLAVQARRYIDPNNARTGAQLARQTISRIENGHRSPDPWVQEAIAKALGVQVGELLAPVTAVAETQASYEIAKGRAELPAEVEDVAQRIAELPTEVRGRLVRLVELALALADDDLVASLSAQQRMILAYFDQLTEQNQQVALDELKRMLGERAGSAGEQTGALGTS